MSVSPERYRSLSCSELRDILTDDGKMEAMLRVDDKFQELQVERESLLASNRSLAEESLERRPRLLHGKVRLAEKYLELSNLATACWEKQSRLEEGVGKQSMQTAQNLLQEEVGRAEERSEELLEKLMEGSVSVDSFLDSFQSSRKTYHVRRAQAEKMQEALESRRTAAKSRRSEELREEMKDSEPLKEPPRPNGLPPQGPLRVFQVRYGLTPAILLPHYPASPSAPSPHGRTSLSEHGHAHILTPPPHGQPVGLRVIGQLPGGWPVGGRPVRVQQLYRPSPQQTEPPFR